MFAVLSSPCSVVLAPTIGQKTKGGIELDVTNELSHITALYDQSVGRRMALDE
jgi:hypothetical protein